MVKTSYELSLLLARKKKPYSDGEEVIKNNLLIFAQNVGDSNIKHMVDQIALSRNTVMRRIDDMGQDVETQIIAGIRDCKYFSLALDESYSFDVAEELLDLRQLVSTTGQDVLYQVKNVIEGSKVEWSKLESVCTDGAPSMVGRIKGFATLLENFLGRNVFKFHCIIHQEAICAKDLDLSSVIEPVSRCINKIHARASNRRRFRELFQEETEEAGELLLYCSVRWLSKGNALARFWDLKECVLQFLEKNEELPNECSLLKNEDWLWDLAFLADIMRHLNILNLRLQRKYCIFPTLVSHDYGCVVYDSANQTLLKTLDTLQSLAVRLALGAYYTSPVDSLLYEAGELPLNLKRAYLTLHHAVANRFQEIYQKGDIDPVKISNNIRSEKMVEMVLNKHQNAWIQTESESDSDPFENLCDEDPEYIPSEDSDNSDGDESIYLNEEVSSDIETDNYESEKEIGDAEEDVWTDIQETDKLDFDEYPTDSKINIQCENMSPLDIFCLFVTDEILELIVQETNRYAEQEIGVHSIKQKSNNPFICEIAMIPEEPSGLAEAILELRSNIQFESKPNLLSFWMSKAAKAFKIVHEDAVKKLLPFGTTYLCEQGFSTLMNINTKNRNRLNAEDCVQSALTSSPNFEAIVSNMKPLP
ncbi:uncharacterized protein [Diabrotica undecimpunctata]|uniref:uncharacterized protein n=1 Tax=Diabrotica undecimpunctata TaxID=50387 RepID=UPI003B63582D